MFIQLWLLVWFTVQCPLFWCLPGIRMRKYFGQKGWGKVVVERYGKTEKGKNERRGENLKDKWLEREGYSEERT